MMKKLKQWWTKRTYTEKLMYPLILVLLIGIATRWRYVAQEVGDGFASVFSFAQSADTTAQVRKPQYVVPVMPSVIAGTEQAPLWLAEHFWDKTYLADSSYGGYPSVMEDAIRTWGEVLLSVDDATAARGVRSFLDKASGDSVALRVAIEKVEWAFYDPNSPVRNFEAYIAALEWIVGSEKLSELEKMRPQAHLERVLKNRKGNKANDFAYVGIDGRSGSLYGLRNDYTLLFFYNPDCPSCAEYKSELLASPVIERMVNDGKLKVLGVYTDGDETLWKDRADGFPSTWMNGMDVGMKIKENASYELNVIPTLFLLDKSKTVLLKDARPAQVEAFLLAL